MSAPQPAPSEIVRYVVDTDISFAYVTFRLVSGSMYTHSDHAAAVAQAAELNRRDQGTGYTWSVYRVVVSEGQP